MNKKNLTIGTLLLILIAGAIYLTQQKPINSQTNTMVKDSAMTDEKLDKMSDNEILGLYMKAGKILTVWPNNELAQLEKDTTLKSGIKVLTNGTITLANGHNIDLKEGEFLNLEGQISLAGKELLEAKTIEQEDVKMSQDEDSMIQEDSMTKDTEKMEKTDSMMEEKHGYYKDYSPETVSAEQKAGQKVVLFFHAVWCPYCKAADAEFKAHADKIPAGVTVLKTDYDSQTELKKKYGVTYQHTFVQIDNNGNQVTKWVSGDVALLTQNIK